LTCSLKAKRFCNEKLDNHHC